MSEGAPLWICEGEVCELLDLAGALPVVERAFELEARDAARNLEKTTIEGSSGSSLHALGASLAEVGVVGVKSWSHTARGSSPLLCLWSGGTGALLAVIEAFALGQLRTAAVSAVATRWLAAEQIAEAALFGTGRQALPQLAALAAVRPLQRVRVFGRDSARRAAFLDAVAREGLRLELIEARSVEEAADGALLITLATRAREPFLHASMLRPGTHVNAIGAIVPSRQEFAPDLFPRCAVVAADSVHAALALSREFGLGYGPERADPASVRRLCDIVAGRESRPAGADLTLFKAMGVGIADVALGAELLDLARAARLGRELDAPGRAAPRLRVAPAQARRTG